tara:strand:- start:268607 stop:268891 length:285 start_codon:yes stop_codon:yes gene_type:complete
VAKAVEGEACPALEREGELYFCGLYRKPSLYIDTSWISKLDDALQTRALQSYSAKVTQRFESALTGVCDSVYGQREYDERIPVHIINEEGNNEK